MDYTRFLNPSTIEGAITLGVLAGIAVLGIQELFKRVQTVISNVLLFNLNNEAYSLNGYWVAYEYINEELATINFNKIIQKKQKLQFKIWHYELREHGIKQYYRYFAEGIIQGNHLSAHFYSMDNKKPEVGGAVFQLDAGVLFGKIMQYSVQRNPGKLIQSEDGYKLQRVEIPLICKLRMLLGKAPFKYRQEVSVFADSLNLIDYTEVPEVQ